MATSPASAVLRSTLSVLPSTVPRSLPGRPSLSTVTTNTSVSGDLINNGTVVVQGGYSQPSPSLIYASGQPRSLVAAQSTPLSRRRGQHHPDELGQHDPRPGLARE